MNVRFLNTNDALVYRELRKFSLQEAPFAFSDSYEDEAEKAIEDYEQEIETIGFPYEKFTLGAYTDLNELIGFVKYKRDQRAKARHRASLHSLYVLPKYRGIGIAKQLVTELLKIVEPISSIEQIQLWALLSDESSTVGFYEKIGFKISGGIFKNDLLINGRYVDAVCMVMNLEKETIKK